jgi:hypothetical protein
MLLALGSGAAAQQPPPRDSFNDFTQTPELPRAPEPDAPGPYGLPVEARLAQEFQEGVTISSRDPIRTADEVGYATGRTVIEYKQFTLEADRMMIDYGSGDVWAEGNVVARGPAEFITADSGRFNLFDFQGVAYGVDGQVRDLFFRVSWDEQEEGPALIQLDENESIFRGMQYTSCNFPVPHYYITATEVILIRQKRVYFRNPTLYVRGVPVLWLPIYTRSLGEGSPWWVEFGYASRIGGFIRVGYRYIHRVQTPRWDDPSKYESRSHGLLDTYVDLMTRRGVGVGARYRYQFDYHRHTGYMEVYGLRDSERDVDGEDSGDERWVYRHLHNSLLTDNLYFQLDADKASDPDIYWDVIDRFAPASELERGRLFEQRIRAALNYRTEDWVARVAVDRKERLTRDRYQDFADPFDDDLDFDPDPDFTDDDEFDEDGISNDRYGRVSENVVGTWGTRLLQLGSAPLYYRFEANAFDSLDAGFNRLDEDDDSRVRGADGYGSLTHRIRLSDRTTWLNTVGVGAAGYDRQENELITNQDFLAATPNAEGVRSVDGVRFVDQETILIGDGPRSASLDDVEPYYLFADYRSRLNHRFTDYLDGFLQYRVRQGTSDSLPDFYENIGYIEAWDNIYDFYHDQHWVEAGLNYFLRYPNMTVSATGGYNLQSTDDIYANERTAYAGLFTTYANDTNEFLSAVGITYETRQIRDYEDPNQYEQGSWGPYLRLSYFPRHARYWAQLAVSSSIKTEDDPVDRDNRQKRRFDENETDINIAPVVGKQFGPKYRVQLSGNYTTRYDTWRRAGITILRDLHDAELGLFFGIRNNSWEARRDDDDTSDDDDREKDYEMEIRTSLRFKIARDQPGLGARSITTLSDLRQEAQYVQ